MATSMLVALSAATSLAKRPGSRVGDPFFSTSFGGEWLVLRQTPCQMGRVQNIRKVHESLKL